MLLSSFKEDVVSYSLEYFFLTALLKRKDETNTSPQWAVCVLEVIFPADRIAGHVPDRFSDQCF